MRFFSKVHQVPADIMTGGTYMHIHSYQIHNVLNVYRRQLSEGAGAGGKSRATATVKREKVDLMANGQRQSIIEKVSTEIVQRIVQVGPKKPFEDSLAQQLRQATINDPAERDAKQSEFTYTMIDEHNRRITNTLTIHNFSPLTGDSNLSMQENSIGTQLADAPQDDRSGDTFEE